MVESTLNESIGSTGKNEEKRLRAEIINAAIPLWTIDESIVARVIEKDPGGAQATRYAILKGKISPFDVTAKQLKEMTSNAAKGSGLKFAGVTTEIEELLKALDQQKLETPK
jgi:hypothetical protein